MTDAVHDQHWRLAARAIMTASMNALGIKGVGEIGVTGSAGAVANAVWHATGVRIRRFPITVEQLIGAGAA